MDFLSIMSYRAKFGRIYRGYIMSNDMKVHSGHKKETRKQRQINVSLYIVDFTLRS